ncbi:DEAD/DEAH box helicase [Endozoicomonas gorgoniicola]|uniref:DEAD/DEAH box helicase n=1 Tax=Endozoicomonas gorgoniicola TaxID=1234144 RepID=A0ABT3MSR1_9GAMM|nr:DEAD/DEAH box helicase [Endozoicomonas gorgoniicola]MCW7552408.1 DEAD/DEAH box helicase [Endozoicomonas gorgoniicola]
MAAQYGQTWWGKQWLEAFNGIDYSNRLPRGRRYAGNGSVSDISLKGTSTHADVKGRRSRPYKVKVHLPSFTAKQQDNILSAISQSPALLAKLLNRQLPVQMLSLMEQQKIPLFPKDWDDMDASCSCPDWAMPCKHIAAVIYLIANEIDKDPFMVFKLHGMDLPAAIERQTGMSLAKADTPPQVMDFWQREPVFENWQPPQSPVSESLDLSTIEPLGERILGILTPKPLFYDKDFKTLLADFYKRSARVVNQFEKQQTADNTIDITDFSLTHLVLDGNGRFHSARCSGNGQILHEPDEWIGLLASLRNIHSAQRSQYYHKALLWHWLYRLAIKLLQQHACIPAVFMQKDDWTLIQWHPALLSEPVKTQLAILYEACPPDFVVLETVPKNRKKPQLHYADSKTQIHLALNAIISFFMEQAMEAGPDKYWQEDICRLFFAGSPCLFNQFETMAYPKVIRNWLNRLSLGEREHRLHMLVEEVEMPEADDPVSDQLSVDIRIEQKQNMLTLPELFKDGSLSDTKVSVLTDLALLADYLPAVEQLYQTQKKHRPLQYTLQAFTPIFRETLPALQMLGIQLVLPKRLRKLVYPQLSLSLSKSGSDAAVSYMNLDELLQFNWQIALGDQRIPVSEFNQLLEGSEGLVKMLDQYVMLDDNKLQQLLKKLDNLPDSLSRIELLKAGLSGELDGAKVDLGDTARQLFEQLLQGEPAPLPEQLNAQLRPYQQRGYEWMAQNARIGFGSLLADDMGLGKTLQVITLLLHQKENGQLDKQKALVVAPTSLLTNWRKEIERFAPDLRVQVYHGSKRELKHNDHDVVLTSYGLIRSDSATLGKPRWRTLVIDEAQNIKNPGSQQTKAVKKLKSDIRIGMSGTPVENRLREYWSVFDFTNKSYLGTQKKFQEELATPIEKDRDQSCLDRFRKLTSPFILRRLKTDKSIISDLPDKVESNRYCNLSKQQASLYQNTVNTIMEDLNSAEEGIERRGIIFKLLNALKQICNAPAQFLNHNETATDESGKLSLFMELMREAIDGDEKVLIFTQYTTMGELLVNTLKQEMQLDVPFLHGGLSRKKRDDMVEDFQNNGRTRAMILSLKAGGTGLNLTAASQVIHYDLWWNPAVEAQATDRAFRIGQKRNVQVHRLITENTFEEKIDTMIQAKKELANLAVASGEQWITELSDQEIRELVSLG